MRKCVSFQVEDPEAFKQKLVCYCQQLKYSAIYDSNHFYSNVKSEVHYHSFNLLAGLGQVTVLEGSFDTVQEKLSDIKDWMFGYWSYDLKNELENLYSVNNDSLNFLPSVFFQPEFVITHRADKWQIGYLPQSNPEKAAALIKAIKKQELVKDNTPVQFKPKVSESRYCQNIDSILDHIQKGDVYELNYCMEFYAEQAEINPYAIFNTLKQVSPTPFATFLKLNDKFVLSASPERYLTKQGDKIISQPIKGTAKRGANETEDKFLKEKLSTCIKERSENIMIADLVRNDLSKIAAPGSVQVEELCGIYPFRQVFQMISTITAQLHHHKIGMDAIKACFPPGSMTGAPKVMAMKLIEKYEETKRGVYSGAIGYFAPDGNFDFNVVIRTLLYNSASKYLSFMVGSAITERSMAAQEYQECLLKAKALLQLFNQEKLDTP